MTFTKSKFPILFGGWSKTCIANAIQQITQNNARDLCDEYHRLVACAPQRSERGKKYFVSHSTASTKAASNRNEEHLAIGLFNLRREWPYADGKVLRILDYQFPLKSTHADVGIGKIDLLGVNQNNRLVVIELKFSKDSASASDAPPYALMEALRYTAIVQANQAAIAAAAQKKFNIRLTHEAPIIMLLGNALWWDLWMRPRANSTRKAMGNWEPEFAALIKILQAKLKVEIACVQLNNVTIASGVRPQLTTTPQFKRVPEFA